ncbi:MAG TPA: rhodanese-related sulfurtransferase [Cyclobacteriaceae bacterium]|nr:rhodanese-related sulfurtransferase [Cyclobacteriaceae bacterium]HRJ82408.1 rhodanese-related sulfurtransferase [Cyclobacteriaceae bacterium]
MQLFNRIEGKLLKERLYLTPNPERTTLSFYKYHQVADPKAFRDKLYHDFASIDVWGRIYVAHEGINGQISVPTQKLNEFRDHLYAIPWLSGIRLNIAVEDNGKSFFKLKILVRNKIVADGLDDSSFDVTDSGIHLNAPDFNKLTEDPETIVVDMRNHYESEVGHFKNAICPDVDTFREALPVVEKMLEDKKDKNVIMYCTGGIRCEKASAWMKHRGFKHVFQLNGGIIEYARQVKEQSLENKFIGKNFVFDERLGERISDEIISTCHQCGTPCDDHTNCKNDGCHLLFIQCKACAEKFNGCCSVECREILMLPVDQQKNIRKGINKGRQVFKKGRSEKLGLKVKSELTQ